MLANDEVKDGLSERGGHPVVRKTMRQWMMRITAYADRLLGDLEELDWSDSVKEAQKHWIGRSEGATVHFKVADNQEQSVEVFTTRPDTLHGVSFMVLAPEHALVHRAERALAEHLDRLILLHGKRPTTTRRCLKLVALLWESEALTARIL